VAEGETSLESRLGVIEGKLDKLMTNDVPHINERISGIETNLSWLIKISSLVLAVVILGMVEIFFMK
tara:strand:- start:239 stop:439 length:201 start_codon:yes stop_codon:yes gene_type:complete